MSNRFKTLFVVMAILGVFLTIQLNDAMATSTPTGECRTFAPPWEPGVSYDICRYTIDDLGAFDATGVWVWDTDFETRADDWMMNDPVNQPWRVAYAPYEDVAGIWIPILEMDQPPPGDPGLYLLAEYGVDGIINFELFGAPPHCDPALEPGCVVGPPGEFIPGENDCEALDDFCFRNGEGSVNPTSNENIPVGTPMCINRGFSDSCNGPEWGDYIPCTDPSFNNLCYDAPITCPEPCDPTVDPFCPGPVCGGVDEPPCPAPPIEGHFSGLTPKRKVCINKTTGQKVVVKDQAMSLNCEAAGLEMNPGDIVVIKMRGIVD
jgi:hypothetical protein